MANISHLEKYNELTNRSNKTYGLLSNEATAIMQGHKSIPLAEILVLGRKGVINLNMLYNWWIIYAFQNHLIKDGKWIKPNKTHFLNVIFHFIFNTVNILLNSSYFFSCIF